MKLIIVTILAGVFFALPAPPVSAEPVDCEAARCTVQAAIDTECPCAEAKNHGRYTSCVSRVVNGLVRQGLVPKKCRSKIADCSIHSTCGKRDGSVSCQLPGSPTTSRCRPLSSELACTGRGGTVVASCCDSCSAPVPTATPVGTATPVETTTPVETVTPAETTTPVETVTPAETATPVETETPVVTATPVETGGPVATATESPVETATPVVTGTPVVTATIAATETPVVTATPVETITPVVSGTAVVTTTPVVTGTAVVTTTPVPTLTSTPVATLTATPLATATATFTAAATATVTATPIATATVTATRTATPVPTLTATRTATPVPTLTATVTATRTATPIPTTTATGTPVPTVTSTPSGPVCGDGVVTAPEQCDINGPQCPNAGNGLETCSLPNCRCLCPTKISFTGDATSPASILDTGWTGIAHRAPVIANGDVTIGVTCAAQRPCGTCTVLGPIANVLPNQISNRRCTNDTSIKCTSNTPCTAGSGTCAFFFGSTLPLAAGGVGTCVVNQFNGPITGTANIESGETATTALLSSKVFTGPTDNPCPRCSDNGVINDGLANGGVCDDGPRVGMACDANGFVPGRPDFGRTSLDCPPPTGTLVATLPIDLSNATDPVTKTLSAASPNCGGEPTEKCLCDTCNNAAATVCDDNADCIAVGATVCGGRRCIGGTNDGNPCNNNTACPAGGLCGKPGEPSKPSACLDDTSTVGILDCTDTAPVDQEGECTSGPVTKTCSVASGHGQRSCGQDVDCGGGAGTCVAGNRACFLTGGFTGKIGTNTLIAIGMEDPPMNDTSSPTLAAVFCVGPTSASAVNSVAGLPGPGRVTIKGTARGLP